MKVTATTPLRHGTKDGVEDIAEGASFDCDAQEAEDLIAAGLAVKGHAKPKGEAAARPDTKA